MGDRDRDHPYISNISVFIEFLGGKSDNSTNSEKVQLFLKILETKNGGIFLELFLFLIGLMWIFLGIFINVGLFLNFLTIKSFFNPGLCTHIWSMYLYGWQIFSHSLHS